MEGVRGGRGRWFAAGRRPRTRHRLSVWHSLVAIAVLPGLGMPILAGVLTSGRLQDARTAARIERDLAAVQALDQLRAALNDEVTAGTLTLLANQLRLPLFLFSGELGLSIGSKDSARAATDRILAGLPAVRPLAGRLEGVPARLRELRGQVDAAIAAGPQGLPRITTLSLGYTDLGDQITDAELLVTRAVATGAEGLTSQQLLNRAHSLDALASVVSSIDKRAGMYYMALLAPPSLMPQVRARLLNEDATERVLAAGLVGQLTPSSARAWQRYLADPTVRQFEAAVARNDPAELNKLSVIRGNRLALNRVAAILPMVQAGLHVVSELSHLLMQGTQDAAAAARADNAAAQRRAVEAMTLTGALLLITGVALLLIGGTLRRRLELLAVGAQRLSAGYLDPVPVHGPRELASASVAINDAVASLRHVQLKADLLASGDLDSPELERPAPGPLGSAVHASVTRIVSAVREREELRLELAHQASHDPLTDLPNRAEIDRTLAAALHRARSAGTPVSVLFIDLDRFKACNDRLGHAAGDHVLRTVARRLAGVVRGGDIVGRLGGDEFVVIIEGSRLGSELHELGGRIVAAVSEPIEYEGQLVRIGASVGLAGCAAGDADPDRLLREADAAVYRAKADGGGAVVRYDRAVRAGLEARRELEQGIVQALARQEFLLHYQPLVTLNGAGLCGFEALIRWQRPGSALLAAGDFLPELDGSDLDLEIGRWVLGEATRQLAEWSADPALREQAVAVNLSAGHLLHPGVVADVRTALGRSGLAAERLIIEIPESARTDAEPLPEHLRQLAALGVRLALDHFGTRPSSIGQLFRLPIDILKLESGLVAGLADQLRGSGDDRPVGDLIAELAGRLNLTIVAEGIEEPEQLAALAALAARSERSDRVDRVEAAQGFLFSRPLPPAEALAWARANQRVSR